MPRIRNSKNDPLDFCIKCFPKSESFAFQKYGNVGDGPDGRGNCFAYDDDHPPYEFEDYRCEKCDKLLTENDNGYV